MYDGDKSILRASDQEVTFQTASAHIAISADGDSCDNEHSADDASLGPSIDYLVTEKRRGRKHHRLRHGAASRVSRPYKIADYVKPKMEASNMNFILQEFDGAKRLYQRL